MMEHMLKGRCLCGGIRFEIDDKLGPVIYCHCSRCRRASGSSFATNATVHGAKLRILAGSELISEYNFSPGAFRRFCSRCGSPLFLRNETYPSLMRVTLGSLQSAGGAKSVAHVWTGSKSEWFDITDHLKQFEEEPPDEYCAPA